jgi:hypothetical protein
MIVLENITIPFALEKEIVSNTDTTQLTNYLADKRSIFDPWLSKILGYSIVTYDAWVNYIAFDGIINEYEWHNEQGIGGAGSTMTGDLAGIIWLSGNENAGGNLSVIENDEVLEIKFKLNTLIIIDSSTFHRVEHYYGNSKRISLNFTFNKI